MKRIPIILFFLLLSLACQRTVSESTEPSAAPARPATTRSESTPTPAPQAERASTLRHIMVLTGGAEDSDALPLIVALHGLGNTPEAFAKLFATFDTPARLLLPEGPLPARGEGASWFRIQLEDGRLHLNEEQIAEACAEIARLTRQIQRRHPTRGKPVLTGFSQGGILSYAMAVRHPELFARVVPVAGWLPPGLLPEDPAQKPRVPVRALHGQADPIVRFAPTRKLVEDLKAQGYDVELVAYPGVKHSISGAMRAELFRLLREGLERNPPNVSPTDADAGERRAPATP